MNFQSYDSRPSSETAETTSLDASEPGDDDTLLARLRRGEESAFSETIGRYRQRAYTMAYRHLGNHQDAEEVTQDTFINAFRGIATFRGDSAFSTWLFRIAINLARNKRRYWWVRKRDSMLSLDSPLSDADETPLSEQLPAQDQSPYDVLITQDLLERVREGSKRLSTKDREILLLKNVSNMPYEKIAKKLEISVGTVKSRIARARKRLHALAFIESAAPERMNSRTLLPVPSAPIAP